MRNFSETLFGACLLSLCLRVNGNRSVQRLVDYRDYTKSRPFGFLAFEIKKKSIVTKLRRFDINSII